MVEMSKSDGSCLGPDLRPPAARQEYRVHAREGSGSFLQEYMGRSQSPQLTIFKVRDFGECSE